MSLRLGLIGHPVSHSLSPPMHRAAFSFFGIAGSYELFDMEAGELAEGIERLKQNGYSGFNVTIPHKEAVFRMLPRRSLEAWLVGAVNTVRIDSAGQLWAHNTDLGGFSKALGQTLAGKGDFSKCIEPALVLGAGGAARACIAGLFLSGCRNLVVAARRLPEAGEICNSVCSALSKYLASKCQVQLVTFEQVAGLGASYFSLVINCTPVGLGESPEAPIWIDSVIASMSREALLFDSVYKTQRRPTLLMARAQAEGLRSVDGLEMLVEQAVLAFEYWTGRPAAAELMHDALVHNQG